VAQRANEQNVYTFSDVSFTLGGKRYNVAGIVFSLVENGIPEVTVTVDPAHNLGAPLTPAVTTTLTLIKQINDAFQMAAVRRSKASLAFKWACTDGQKFQVSLNDWICTSAGFSPVSAVGGVALRLTISHPVVILNGTSIVLGNITGGTSSMYAFATGNNVLETVKAILTAYQTVKRQPDSPTPDPTCITGDMPDPGKVLQFLQTRITAAANAIPQTLTWHAPAGLTNWPLQYCAADLVPYIRYALVDQVCAGTEFNVWDLLIQRIFPAFMLALVPLWTQKQLRVQPAGYWASPQLFINEWEINSVALPPTDPQPVAGTMFLHGTYTPTGGEESLIDQSSFQMRAYSQMAYVPDMFVQDPLMFGRIIMASPPFWFPRVSQLAQDPRMNSLPGRDTLGAGNGPSSSSPQEAMLTDPTSSQYNEARYKALLRAYARALFQELFRRGMQIRLTTKLMINHPDSQMPDKLMVPGAVCRILTAQGKLFYDFYVTHVVHVIDVQNNNAHTEIGGMFVRTENQYGGIVRTGVPNVLYALVSGVEQKGATPEATAEESSLGSGPPPPPETGGLGAEEDIGEENSTFKGWVPDESTDSPESGGGGLTPIESAAGPVNPATGQPVGGAIASNAGLVSPSTGQPIPIVAPSAISGSGGGTAAPAGAPTSQDAVAADAVAAAVASAATASDTVEGTPWSRMPPTPELTARRERMKNAVMPEGV